MKAEKFVVTPEAQRLNRISQRRQIEREIICLERQLSRLSRFDTAMTDHTLSSYREMIETRQSMLSMIK